MTYINPVIPVVLVLALAGLRFRKVRLLAIVALFLWVWRPVSYLMLGSLEWQSPAAPPAPGGAEAIVVLAGSVVPPDQGDDRPQAAPNTLQRCRRAAALQRRLAGVPVLASGGHARINGVDLCFSRAMAGVLEAEGVPARLIWTEEQSTSTYENALYSARILRAKGIRRIALVTEAYHMPRAAGSFRKQGLEVAPAPCGSITAAFVWEWGDFIPDASCAMSNDLVLHEWVGLAWYRLSGRM